VGFCADAEYTAADANPSTAASVSSLTRKDIWYLLFHDARAVVSLARTELTPRRQIRGATIVPLQHGAGRAGRGQLATSKRGFCPSHGETSVRFCGLGFDVPSGPRRLEAL
jgi:hypothetical protein